MKKIRWLKTIFMIGILTFSLLPIKTYADTIDNSNLESYSYYVEDEFSPVYDVLYGTNTYAHITKHSRYIHIEGVLDQEYVGYARIKFVFSTQKYELNNGSYSYATHSYTLYQYTYINGNYFEIVYDHTTENNADNPNYSITVSSVEIVSSDVVLKSSLNSVQDIEDKIDQVLNLLNNVQWNFPVESLSYIWPYFKTYNLTPVGMSQDNYFTFPIFSLNSNNYVIDHVVSTSSKYTYVMFIQGDYAYNLNGFLNYVDLPSECTITNYNYLYQTRFFGSQALYCVKFDIQSTSSNVRVKIKSGLSNVLFIPVYHGPSNNKYLSTDFCLQFGLTNSFLDNINTIASGTNQSQSSSSAADQENASFSDQASDLYDQENDFISDFQDSLSDVSPDFNMSQGFGSLFMTSATWVRDQFDNIVDGTPFASLLTFSLTLGIGLLIIGKVIHK